jgi:hypothetical protein
VTASTAASWWQKAEEEEGAPWGEGGLLPFIVGGGGWKRVAQVAARDGGGSEIGGAVERWRPQSECCQHGRHRYSDSVADERGPRGFLFFPNYPN